MILTDDTMPITWDRLAPSVLAPLLEACQTYCAFSRNKKPCTALTADSYRSDAFGELAQRVLPQSCHTPFSSGMAEAFSGLLGQKVMILRDQEAASRVRVNVGYPLSLLLVRWRDSMFDGACAPETYGYINEDGIPGWDTWVAIVSLAREQEGYALLCWVPPELCRDVDSAIALDAAASMSWLAFDRHCRPLIVGWGRRWEPAERA